MNAEDDPPDLCYLGAAFPDDTSDDFIGHSHLVSLMRAPAPTSSTGQRGQSWNGHISDILFFQVFSIFFRYYSASGAWLAHLQGREPRGQIRLIRSIRWCWWDRRQPAREGAARPSPSVQRTLSSRHQGKSLDTDDSERLKSKWKHLKTKWVKRELFYFFSDTHVFETNLQCCNIFHCHLWRGGKDNI